MRNLSISWAMQTLRMWVLVATAMLPTNLRSKPQAKVAVLPARLSKAVATEIEQGILDEAVLSFFQGAGDFSVIGPSDMNAVLGFERQKDLLGCTATSCFAEIGGALGVGWLVEVQVGRLGGAWTVVMKLMAVNGSPRVVARVMQADVATAGRELLRALEILSQRLLLEGGLLEGVSPDLAQSKRAAAEPAPPPKVKTHTVRNDGCRAGTAFIPGGIYFEDYENEYGNPRKRKVRVKDVCMDLTEVTVDAYALCRQQGVCTDPKTDKYKRCNWAVDGRGKHPINCVDWEQANKYCSFVGGRLPKSAEWFWAARGGKLAYEYPWGTDSPWDQLCWAGEGNTRGTNTNSTCEVGSYPKGVSIHGVYDLEGNVEEWTSDTYYDNKKEYRGCGTWTERKPSLVRVVIHGGAEKTNRSAERGFRCVYERQ